VILARVVVSQDHSARRFNGLLYETPVFCPLLVRPKIVHGAVRHSLGKVQNAAAISDRGEEHNERNTEREASGAELDESFA
jgi:hypothetical protein